MFIDAKQRVKKLFSLRVILLVVMLSVLLMPLGSLYFFRFYENVLVQKTEIELITQSAVIGAVYRELIGKSQPAKKGEYYPIEAQLDLSKQKLLPPRPDARLYPAYKLSEDYEAISRARENMLNILVNTQYTTLAGIRILNTEGVVVVGQSEVNMSMSHINEVKSALAGKYTSVIRERISEEPTPSIASISRGTGIRVFVAFPIMNQGEVVGVVYTSRTPQNILKHLYSIKEKVIFLTLLLLGLTGIIVLFISSRLSRPIRELIEQTQKVTSGESMTVQVLKQPGTYELAELSNSFAKMSETLYERSQYINHFASHVSHEFKTPLTSMQGSLELLQEHGDDMPEAQRIRFIQNVTDDTERLKRLVNRLLEQARADSIQKTTETTNLLTCLKKIESRYTDSDLAINIKDRELMNVNINMASSSLYSVLSNLSDNSMQHEASQLHISVIKYKNTIELAFQDNGSGISEANQKRIFTPFFTTKRETGGTGLGLGIIESLLKSSNGSIQNNKSQIGALFIVTLELSS